MNRSLLGTVCAVGTLLAVPMQYALPAVTAQSTFISSGAIPPAVVPSEVFTGTVKRVVDPVTLQIDRDASASTPVGPVLVRLWGVQAPAGRNGARKLLEQTVGKRVRVEVRSGTPRHLKSATATRGGLVYVLPESTSTPLAASASADKKAPPVVLLQRRAPDATNMTPNVPRDPGPPNLPAVTNQPVPPPAAVIRAEDAINVALIRQGIARWDRRSAGGTEDLRRAEEEAQRAKVGLWGGRQ